jgi:NDP-sugar pyrophosphorylase family protein
MQCLILAGGLGTRMRPRTHRVPKALIPVAGEPFAHHQLSWLASAGVKRVVYSLGYKGDMIRKFVVDGSRWGLHVTYVDEADDLLGTGGAVRKAVDAGALDPMFLILYGDSYLRVDVGDVWRRFIGGGAPALMTVYANHDALDHSNVVMQGGRLVLYDKHTRRPDMTHIDYGLSGLSVDTVRARLPPGVVFDLSDLFRDLSIEQRLVVYEVAEPFYEVGSPAGLKALDALLRSATTRPGLRR